MAAQFLKGLLFGGIVGGIGGLLTAPKSGEELREDLQQYLDDTTEATLAFKDSVVQLKDAASQTQQAIQDTVPVINQLITKDVKAFQFVAEPRIQRIQQQTEELTNKIAQLKPEE